MPDGGTTGRVTGPAVTAFLVALPELLGAAMAGFCVGPMLLLVMGHFNAAVGVPLGIVGAALACAIAGIARTPVRKADVAFTFGAIGIAVWWFFYNVHYTAQDVYATRDPAAYTTMARWLVDHGSLQIHAMSQVFGNQPDATFATGSYAKVGPDVLNGQGNHLLSAFSALGGSMFGTTALLATNTLLTALALLVFFGFARRMVGPLLALGAMTALALSMPIIYTGRDMYTEPLTMLYLMAALTFVHRGFSSRRWRDWAIAGLAGGAATCVRVDSYLALVGVIAAITVFVAVAEPQRRNGMRCAIALLAGASAPFVFGWLDLTHLSRQYYQTQHGNISHMVALLAFTAVAAPGVVWMLWRTRLRGRLAGERARRRINAAAVAVLVAVFVALLTRPSWQTTHGPFRPDLVNMQLRWGAPVDGTRTYNEQTVRWLHLYFGWPTLILAVLGYAVLITALVRRRAYALTGALAMGLTMSALYLYTVEAAPDQPWAMRRYVPVVLPMMLVAASAALRAMWRSRAGLVLWPVVGALFVYSIWFPYTVSRPLRHLRDEVPQLAQLNLLCHTLPHNAAVLETDNPVIFGYGQSIRSFCNVPTIGLLNPTSAQLAQVNASVTAHGRVLYVLTQDPATVPFADSTTPASFSKVHVTRWPTQINKPPVLPDEAYTEIWLATVDASGLAHPVNSGS